MDDAAPKRVLLVGATGTIGRAVAKALVNAGHDLICVVRDPSNRALEGVPGAEVVQGDVTDAQSLQAALGGRTLDAFISCLASRTGAAADAWAIDHQANLNVLEAAKSAGANHGVLLSAICVQKPHLAFQQAKLAFEASLKEAGLRYTIVRPTAFFKSLSGQFDRVKSGKPFLVFGDGHLTACKPISDRDLAQFLVNCLGDPKAQNAVLPIGGPGPALTPMEQGETLFAALGRTPRFKRVPIALLSTIIVVLSALGKLFPKLAEKAELARIGRYYATESMLVWNADTGVYDADATPEHGTDPLADHFVKMAQGQVVVERGDHAVF